MNRKLLLFGGGGLAVIAAAVFAAWFFYFRSDAPEEVSLEGALETVRTPTVPGPTAAGATPAGGATQPAGGSASGGLDGTWTVATAGETFVGYRVQEELAQIGAVTAVGRTSDVKGSVVIAGNRVEPGSTFTANMQALKSDRSQRDNALRTQALETNRFPTSTFTLKEAVTLPASFANGEALTTTLKGSLELHGVTRDVEIPVQAKLENGLIVVVGSLEIRFADYDIAQPRAPIVLSVDDKGVMEIQLVLQKQG
mgnify:CR=1 FL=1